MLPPSDTAVSVTLTPDERAYLELYTPRTHGVELPRDLAKSMEAKGWVEWVPPMFGSSRLYSTVSTVLCWNFVTPPAPPSRALPRDDAVRIYKRQSGDVRK
jgi:hypothetical protein